MFTIRPAGLNDSKPIAGMLRGLGLFSRLDEEPAEATADRVYRHLRLCLADSSHSVYVGADDGGEIAGYLTVHWQPYLFLPGPEGYISELFLRENARGQGLGRELLETVKREAVERGCYRLCLLNGKHRESYQRGFYEKNGWEERPGMANFVYYLQEK